jgi:hypothetical protein
LSREADIFQVKSFAARSKPSNLQEGIPMGEKLGNFSLVTGFFLMLLGLCLVPAAMAEHQDETILSVGICAFAFGALCSATGFYLKARAVRATLPTGVMAGAVKSRGSGCDLCKDDAPAVLCRVHNLHMCADCLSEHYDFRSCVYVPSTRRGAPTRPAARAARA